MKEVVSLAKDLAKISELKLKIAEKEATKNSLINKLGKKVYEEYPAVNLEAITEVVEEIKKIDEEIEVLNSGVIAIKGLQKCPVCNTLVKNDMKYCGQCGTKLVEDEPPVEEEVEKTANNTEQENNEEVE